MCATQDGELATVAVKKSTTPPEVWFRRSTTGGTVWPTTAPDGSAYPVKIGDLGSSTGKVVNIQQLHAGGRNRLVVDNGLDWIYYSDNMGKTWTSY